MGLTVSDAKESTAGPYANLLRVRYETGEEVRELVGTVIGSGSVRLVGLDGYRFEVNPEGNMLIYSNIDKPGMLARVGTILARHNVNIAGVSLGRDKPGAEALTLMNIVSGISAGCLDELQGAEGVTRVRVIRLE
jgi:D-3-phosphoglycerate dehydrogenase